MLTENHMAFPEHPSVVDKAAGFAAPARGHCHHPSELFSQTLPTPFWALLPSWAKHCGFSLIVAAPLSPIKPALPWVY